MVGSNTLETLLIALGQAVERATARFEKEPAENRVQAGQWGPAEVLSHFIFWHGVTLKGIESVVSGGEPYRFDADATLDGVNAAALAGRVGSSIADMTSELGELHSRIEEGARGLEYPSVAVRFYWDGSERSLETQLQTLTVHIGDHLEELDQASDAPPGNRE